MFPSFSHLLRAIAAVIIFCTIRPSILPAQPALPTLFDERGDTIHYVYPPDTGSYVADEIIIKFRTGALDLSLLCYEYPEPIPGREGDPVIQSIGVGPAPSFRAALMDQRFHVDSGIVLSPALVAAMKNFGGTTLRRITVANPCHDTSSISRRGDTLTVDDFNWMVLEFDNDTSVINASLWLTIQFQEQIEIAEPNYYIVPLRDPSDYYFGNSPFQASLGMIGMPTAWDHITGSPEVRVGVIDDGVDYRHCDLGGALGAKVKDGKNYVDPNAPVYTFALHGTPCAGIIGAYTNRTSCIGVNPTTGAGVAGGWGPDNGSGEDNPGVSLWGYAFAGPFPGNTDRAIAAIREASANGTFGRYGDAMEVLNFSGKVSPNDDPPHSGSLQSAVNDAFEHGVSLVASRGNDGDTEPDYPACYEASWVLNVGGSRRNRDQHTQSSYGGGVDVIAPYGGKNFDPPQSEKTVYTIAHTGPNGEEPNKHDYFEGTSASAPHVSGVVALLRSYFAEKLDPEDYEGMIKASTEDRNPITTPGDLRYLFDYDEVTGWGHLQADNLFTMPTEDGYQIKQFTVIEPTDFGEWEGPFDYYFSDQLKVNKPLEAGNYRVRRREVSTGFDLQTHGPWSSQHELYVWGRGGNRPTGGFSAANPNFQTRWTEVTSGEGGNGLTAGIIHSHTNLCTARTFQYDVQRRNQQTGEWEPIGRFPADNDLAFHITIFAVPVVSSVRVSDDVAGSIGCNVAPNPAREEASLTYTLHRSVEVMITLMDALGQEVRQYPAGWLEPGIYESRLNLADIAAGLYYCWVETGDGIVVEPLIIAR